MNNTEKIYQAAATAFAIPLERVHDDLAYQSISEWDSLSHLLFIDELETRFDQNIQTEDILAMSSIAVAKDILAAKYNVSFDQ